MFLLFFSYTNSAKLRFSSLNLFKLEMNKSWIPLTIYNKLYYRMVIKFKYSFSFNS